MNPADAGELDRAAAVEELRTARDMVRWTASRLEQTGVHFGHGTDNAVDEAAWIVAHSLGMSPMLSEVFLDARLTRGEREVIAARVGRRCIDRVPTAYITGEAWFGGRPFHVDERVLVPRSPFAELVEAGFEPWVDGDRVRRIADVGTGSGCIAISCAHAFPEAEVDATDVSTEALAVAALNVEAHAVGDRVRLLHADVLDGLEGPYDLIVSNPPYVPVASMDHLAPEYRHEPRTGLEAGPDGLDVVARLLDQARSRLTAEGVLFIEVGEAADYFESRFDGLDFTWIELEHGGDGLLVVDAAALAALQ